MASALGLELHHPTESMMWGNRDNSKIKISIFLTNLKVVSVCKSHQEFGMPLLLTKHKSGSGCKSHREFDTSHFLKKTVGR